MSERIPCPDCWPGHDSDSHAHIFDGCPHVVDPATGQPVDGDRCRMNRPCRPRAHWPSDCPWWPVDPTSLRRGDTVRAVIGNGVGWHVTAHLIVESHGDPTGLGPTFRIVPVLGLDSPQAGRPEIVTYNPQAQVIAARSTVLSEAHSAAVEWALAQDLGNALMDLTGRGPVVMSRAAGSLASLAEMTDEEAAYLRAAEPELVARLAVALDGRPGCPDCVTDSDTPDTLANCRHGAPGLAGRCPADVGCQQREHLAADCPWWPVPIGQVEPGDVIRGVLLDGDEGLARHLAGKGARQDTRGWLFSRDMMLVVLTTEGFPSVAVSVLDPHHPVPSSDPESCSPYPGLTVLAARTRTDSVSAVLISVAERVQSPPGARCRECASPDDDPSTWCDCRGDEPLCRSDRVCRKRAHQPADCPWWPTTWGAVDVGDTVKALDETMWKVGAIVRFDGQGSFTLLPVKHWKAPMGGSTYVTAGSVIGVDQPDDAPVTAARGGQYPGTDLNAALAGDADPKAVLSPGQLAAADALATGGLGLSVPMDGRTTGSGA